VLQHFLLKWQPQQRVSGANWDLLAPSAPGGYNYLTVILGLKVITIDVRGRRISDSRGQM